MKIDNIKVHPRNSSIYGDESESIKNLASDIEKNGMIEPIIINQDNIIISGHRRYQAAKMLGHDEIKVVVRDTTGENNLLEMLLLYNLYRDKTTLQKLNEAEAWEGIEREKGKERQLNLAGTRPNSKTALQKLNEAEEWENVEKEKANERFKKRPLKAGSDLRDNCPQGQKGKSRDAIAKRVGFGSGKSYERAKKTAAIIKEKKEQGKEKEADILTAALNRSVNGALNLAKVDLSILPDTTAADIREDKITVAKVHTSTIRDIKRADAIDKLKEIESIDPGDFNGKYNVVVIDPPWPMKKIERDVRPNQVNFDYPTMSEIELSEMELPCADDCHVFLWTTHKFIPMAFRLLDKWGLKYVCLFTWHKPGGFQPIGLPQYNSEFVIYARKGFPFFVDTKAFNTCFNAPRGAHSEKPEEFYEIINRVTSGKRIDIFNRRKITGFDAWGKEANNV